METIVKSVLDPLKHQRLIAELDRISQMSGVPKQFIKSSMKDWCDEQELQYVRNFRQLREQFHGMAIVGKSSVDERCMAMAGAFIRNFIDARVMSLVSVLDAVENHDLPAPTVLLIPNFQVNASGKTLPAWKLSQLHDVLVGRALAGQHTVVGVESIQAMKSAYGQQLSQVVCNYFGGQE